MTDSFPQRLEANGRSTQAGCSLPARDRVLEVACEMFAETGFHGTHLREICKRARTNVAGVCYYFQSKEGLYKAVMMEARRSLSQPGESSALSRNLSPEQRMLRLAESLLERLSAKGAWIAKLLARELVDPVCGAQTYAASGLERDFVLLQAALTDLLGADASQEAIRFQALSLIGESVLCCLGGTNPHHPLIQLAAGLPTRTRIARFFTGRFSETLEQDLTGPALSVLTTSRFSQ